MSKYEILSIISAQYTETELPLVLDKVKKTIEKFGGKILTEENLGKKKLTYPIKKIHQGYYILHEFEIQGSQIHELDNSLKLSDEVVRHIIVKSYPKKAAPASIAKKKPEAKEVLTEITAETTKMKKEEEKEKIKLEDLDKKLDEILDSNNLI